MPTLDWLNRANAFTLAAKVPYRLLEEVSVHAVTLASTHATPAQAELVEALPPVTSNTAPQPTHGNLLIQGDNLEAIKALLPFYRGQVKCIFIDPPYNTKSAFEHYDDNLEHAQWLSMMLPRLQLLRELLREDGSIWVTIDDNEGHYLKVLMDEVFGRGNFVANLAWHKRVSPANDAHYFSNDHDQVLVYARSKPLFVPNKLARSEEQRKYYTNPDNDERGAWNSAAYTCAKTADERPNLYYPLIHPTTGQEVWPKRTRVWAYGRETHEQHLRDKMIYWGVDGNAGLPRIKKFLDGSGDVVPRSVWSYNEAGHNQEAMLEGLKLFGEMRFGTPKPERLLQRVLQVATNPNDLILDSFLGSGTTAAVAHKMGRRWIGIEMGAHAATHCLPRLLKVINGEQGGISKTVNWQGGGGFRFMKLGAPVFDESGRIHPAVRFATLAAFVWQQETGTTLDASHTRPGTPYLGTHYQFGSSLRPFNDGDEPVSFIKTPAFACYLLFNGILKDKRPAGGNVLTQAVLDALLALHATTPEPTAPLLVYGEACRLGEARLAQAHVTFKHIPYDVRAR